MRKKPQWHINKTDVREKIMGSMRSGRTSGRSKQSRAHDQRSLQLTLIHVPTSVEMTGSIEEGNYSRKELRAKKDSSYEELFIELEKKVAKVLRIAGR